MAANSEISYEQPDTGLKSADNDWVNVQKKTFTKWVNSHLKKRGGVVNNLETDFTDGVQLMKLVHALFNTPIPKHNNNAKTRPALLDNCAIAIKLVEQAGVRLHFLKPNHLVDQDLKMILGMIWTIILDFQIKGISVEELTAKEGLLLWCQKKTKGYRDVKVENFTTSWQSGLAFCALIHRHRPDLLDYDSLDKSHAAHNLNLAFDIAEQHLKIPKLLDVEDLLNVARPDERSVMCYISEFFHAFSAQDFKETAARRIQNFVQFHQGIEAMEQNYESGAQQLLNWINGTIDSLNDRTPQHSLESAKALVEEHKNFKLNVKPKKNEERLELEALFANINTKLHSNNRVPYAAPEHLTVTDLDAAWHRLENAESARGKALRENVIDQKEKLRVEFAEKANKFHEWLSSTKDLLLRPQEGDLTTQLEFTKNKNQEIQYSSEFMELEEIQKRMEAAGIDDNTHTDFTFEELGLLLGQLKHTVDNKVKFVEGQILAQSKKGVPPELIKEFKETFLYFDKDASNSLDRLEFKACVQSMGIALPREDTAYDEVYQKVTHGQPEVSFDQFVDYMVKITEDTDTAEQIKQSFKVLANEQASVGLQELQITPLQKGELDYLHEHLNTRSTSDGRYDYAAYVDSVFAAPK